MLILTLILRITGEEMRAEEILKPVRTLAVDRKRSLIDKELAYIYEDMLAERN